MRGKLRSPGNIVIIAAGVVMLLASRSSFASFSVLGAQGSMSAWSSKLLEFPLTIVPVLLGLVMAGQVIVSSFVPQVKLPERVVSLSWNQVHLVCGAQSVILMLSFLFQDRSPLSLGSGYWLMFLSSIGLLAGAVLRTREPVPADVE